MGFGLSKDMIKLGGIGAVICMLAAIEGIVAIVMLWVSPIDYAFAGAHMDFGGGIGWAAGISLISIGAFGLWKHYKHKFSLTVGIVGMITMAAGLIASIILWLNGGATTSISLFTQGVPLLNLVGIPGIVWLELNGVFLILLGVPLFQLKEKTGVLNATRSAGILSLLVGAMYCAVIPFGYLAPQVLTMITTIIVAYVLFKSK